MTEEAGLRELREVVEDWITLGLAMRHALPVIDGIDINPEFVTPATGKAE